MVKIRRSGEERERTGPEAVTHWLTVKGSAHLIVRLGKKLDLSKGGVGGV